MVYWNPDNIIFTLGPVTLRWYALCWSIGLAAAYATVYKLYRRQGIGQDKFDPLFLYCFVGILAGARLGHCLLYEPGYFLSHPLEMLLPARQAADGSWHMTGYAGLASHGGTAGLMLALWLYVKRTGVALRTVLDNIAIATPVTAACIRIGNLMNSEIVGKATDGACGFVFQRLVDPATGLPENFPRHPAQLYEALWYALLFPVGLWLYRRYPKRVGTGFFFGWCLTSIFTFRFFVEYLKEVQEPWELTMQQAIGINQGQLLSLPFAALGLWCWLRAVRKETAMPR